MPKFEFLRSQRSLFVALSILSTPFGVAAAPSTIQQYGCATDSVVVEAKTGKKLPSSMTNSKDVGMAIRWNEGENSYVINVGNLTSQRKELSRAHLLMDKVTTSNEHGQKIQTHEARLFSLSEDDKLSTASGTRKELIEKKSETEIEVTEIASTMDRNAKQKVVTTNVEKGVQVVTSALEPGPLLYGYQEKSMKKTCLLVPDDLSNLSKKGFFSKIRARVELFDSLQAKASAAKKSLEDCLASSSAAACSNQTKEFADAELKRDQGWTQVIRKQDFVIPRPPPVEAPSSSSESSPNRGSSSSSSSSSADTKKEPVPSITYCADGKYHGGQNCTYCPDGKYHSGTSCQYGPDGKYHGSEPLNYCPDGTYHAGKCTYCADGKYHGDFCSYGPDGKYHGSDD